MNGQVLTVDHILGFTWCICGYEQADRDGYKVATIPDNACPHHAEDFINPVKALEFKQNAFKLV